MHLLDSIDSTSGIEFASVHYEQGVGFTAEGYDSVSKKAGVSIDTSGSVQYLGNSYFGFIP